MYRSSFPPFRRFLLCVVIASTLNMILLLAYADVSRRRFIERDWPDFDLPAILWVEFLSFLITMFGLSLLFLVSDPVSKLLPSKLIRIPVFVVIGAILGGFLFLWTPNPPLFAVCGAISAACFASFNPSYFNDRETSLLPEAEQDSM